MSHRIRKTKAFTLVELLVVIGIIALLISILLPSLTRARQAAATIKCEANLRSIMQGAQMYASQNRDWIPAGMTSGLYLLAQNSTYSSPVGPYSETNCPDIIQSTDWVCPIANTLGIKYNHGVLAADRLDRYTNLVMKGMFHCPSDQDDNLLTHYGSGADLGILPSASYFEAVMFTFESGVTAALPKGVTATSGPGRLWGKTTEYDVPIGYVPKISKIRNSTQKISFADGARYVNGTAAGDYDSNISASFGMFADLGAWTNYNGNAISRAAVPGNKTGTYIYDGRVGLRHGGRAKPFSVGGTYKGNCAFWDGHVQTMNDLEMSNPSLWMPTGSLYATGDVWKDAKAVFGTPATTTAISN